MKLTYVFLTLFFAIFFTALINVTEVADIDSGPIFFLCPEHSAVERCSVC